MINPPDNAVVPSQGVIIAMGDMKDIQRARQDAPRVRRIYAIGKGTSVEIARNSQCHPARSGSARASFP